MSWKCGHVTACFIFLDQKQNETSQHNKSRIPKFSTAAHTHAHSSIHKKQRSPLVISTLSQLLLSLFNQINK